MRGDTGVLRSNEYNANVALAYSIFWGAFILYTTCYTLMISGAAPDKITYLQLLAVLVMVGSSVFLIKPRITNHYLGFFYILYFGWALYTVYRGIEFNKDYLFSTFVDGSSGIFLYLCPLVLLFPNKPEYLKIVTRAIVVLVAIYALISLVFLPNMLDTTETNGNTVLEYFSKNLILPAGFILMTIPYQINNNKLLKIFSNLAIMLALGLTVLLAIINARRGLMFMLLNIFFFAYFIYNYSYKTQLFSKVFPIYLLLIAVAYIFLISGNRDLGIIDRLADRVTEDSRGDVEEYFYLDLTSNEWIKGKGINGTYYCPTGATEDGYRKLIETDYLQIILKGGIVNLAILLLITIPAMMKGFFFSKNILSKVAAIWILLWFLALYPATVTIFSFNYLLVWICIGICYSKHIRHMPEAEMKERFQYKII